MKTVSWALLRGPCCAPSLVTPPSSTPPSPRSHSGNWRSWHLLPRVHIWVCIGLCPCAHCLTWVCTLRSQLSQGVEEAWMWDPSWYRRQPIEQRERPCEPALLYWNVLARYYKELKNSNSNMTSKVILKVYLSRYLCLKTQQYMVLKYLSMRGVGLP